jgi:hypothetical protein
MSQPGSSLATRNEQNKWTTNLNLAKTATKLIVTLPFSNDVVFLAEYVVAPVEQFVKLIRWVAELVEAIFPQSHVLEVAEGFFVR